jgi:hypothetical protein
LTVVAAGALSFCQITVAAEAVSPQDSPAPENSLPGPVAVGVSGASAGITTGYFDEAVTDALVVSGIFSGIDQSRSAETIMPMLRVKRVFPGTVDISNTPYFLSIRIIKVETPSFSLRMTVGMNAIWTLYRTADKTELLRENIHSTYTGGFFEGGLHGANRVRVAMEGATRENIGIGIEMLKSLDLEAGPESPGSNQD